MRNIRSLFNRQNILPPIFFTGLFLYLALHADLRLLYHGYGIHGKGLTPFPVFHTGFAFFTSFLKVPGGMLEYVTAFVSQLYQFRFAGPCAVLISAAVLYYLTQRFFLRLNGPDSSIFYYIPSLMMVALFSRYLDITVVVLGLVLSLLVFLLYAAMKINRVMLNAGVIFLLSYAVYYLSGSFVVFFGLLGFLYELPGNRDYSKAALFILFAVSIPVFCNIMICDSPWILSLRVFYPFGEYPAYRDFYALSGFGMLMWYPLTGLIIGLMNYRFRDRKKNRAERGGRRDSKLSFHTLLSGHYRTDIHSLLLALLSVAVLYFSYDGKKRTLLRVNYLSRLNQWDTLLEEARNIPVSDFNTYINHEINKALFFSGRMPDEMFSYPQRLQGFVSPAYPYMDLISHCDTYLNLGLINHAERQASEALALIGEYPEILRQLDIINDIKGNAGASALFQNSLRTSIFTGRENENAGAIGGTGVLHTGSVVSMRTEALNRDYGRFLAPLEERLSELYEVNEKNRMAFEYMMAYFLLSRQTDKIVEYLPCLSNFEYQKIPRHYEEALFIHAMKTQDSELLTQYPLNPELLVSGRKLFALLQRYGKNIGAIEDAVESEFGDSYYFYYVFNYSGVKR